MSDEVSKHGQFCWNELMTRDVEKAGKFYSELIGWNPTDSGMPGMNYTIFKIGGKQAAGLMAMPPEVPKEVPAHWMAYITVDDVDTLAEKAKQLGGQVIHGPQSIPGLGKFAIIQDPTGAVVSLMTFAKG